MVRIKTFNINIYYCYKVDLLIVFKCHSLTIMEEVDKGGGGKI
jgi:hypothetical protein